MTYHNETYGVNETIEVTTIPRGRRVPKRRWMSKTRKMQGFVLAALTVAALSTQLDLGRNSESHITEQAIDPFGGTSVEAKLAALEVERQENRLELEARIRAHVATLEAQQLEEERQASAVVEEPAPQVTTTTTSPPTTAVPETYVETPVSHGSVWDDLAWCESRGDWHINSGNGFYGGLQFMLSTWLSMGGDQYAYYPHEASREQQIEVAIRLQGVQGWGAWPACTAKLGLR